MSEMKIAHMGWDGLMYSCPACACGAVLDWRGEAPLRCTGCNQPLGFMGCGGVPVTEPFQPAAAK